MRAPDARSAAGIALAASLVLAASLPLGWWLTRPPSDEGVVPPGVAQAPTGDPVPSPAVTQEPADDPHRPAAKPPAAADGDRQPPSPPRPAVADVEDATVGTRPARIGDLSHAATAQPQRVRIAAMDLDASVVAVAVDGDGAMEVPADVREVGWYRHGPSPGEPGVAVLAAHVDSREQGPGAFFDLRQVAVGSRIVVTDSVGDDQHFEVVARRTHDKTELPVNELFARTGPARLVLVTCGGDFDREARSYRQNVVVHAAPVLPDG